MRHEFKSERGSYLEYVYRHLSRDKKSSVFKGLIRSLSPSKAQDTAHCSYQIARHIDPSLSPPRNGQDVRRLLALLHHPPPDHHCDQDHHPDLLLLQAEADQGVQETAPGDGRCLSAALPAAVRIPTATAAATAIPRCAPAAPDAAGFLAELLWSSAEL